MSFKVTQGQLDLEKTYYLKVLYTHVVYILTASTNIQYVVLEHGYVI